MTMLQYTIVALKTSVLCEEAALTSHVKDKKLVNRSPFDQYIKSLMPPATAPPLIILKISLSGV